MVLTNSCSITGDVAYLLWGGVIYEALFEHEEQLLLHYYNTLINSFPPHQSDKYTWEEFKHDYDLEFLAYFQTALPQLLNGMTSHEAKKNENVYGWLTYESDPRLMKWGCQRAGEVIRRLWRGNP